MAVFRQVRSLHLLAVFIAALGCRTPSGSVATNTRFGRQEPRFSRASDSRNRAHADTEIQTVTHRQELVSLEEEHPLSDGADFSSDELRVDDLVAAVIARNPSLQAAQAAWAAAAERYPQAVAFDDPMLQSMMAPATFANDSPVQSSYYVGAAQKVPWHGKRMLRGQIAQWDASSVSWSAEEVKLRLAAAARLAYFDYYLVRREKELIERNLELMVDFRRAAKAKYEANQVSEQDLSAADLEVAKIEQLQLELDQTERIAVARINTLLHQSPDATLPVPSQQLRVIGEISSAEYYREIAAEHRPELSSLAAKIQSEQNALALACKEYYPDFEFMGRYDAFWTDHVQRAQIGMNMNVPLNTDRRAAAVREAQFRLAKMIAEQTQQQDTIREEVQIAYSRVTTSQKASELYADRILPAAQTNLDAARAAYVAGTIDFLRLMEARRQYTEQQIAYQKTLTEFHRSWSDLERAVGVPLREKVSP